MPNYGDALKFISPSYNGNIISGWSNYSGMVTAYKIDEKKIGNRVSKSNKLQNLFVKEQRVDGNCCTNLNSIYKFPPFGRNLNIEKVQLRYTLTVFERRYQVRIPSNLDLNPWFITGFTDAEGSFMLKVSKNRSQLEFAIGLHITDLEILQDISKYLGVGNLRVSSKVCVYSVVKIDDIINVIIPFFDKYQLQTKKRGDYLLWKKAANLKYKKKVKLEELISIKASMNRGLNEELKNRFPLIKAVDRPIFKFDLSLDPNWVSGFVSGDGGFFVSKIKKESLKVKYQVRLRFNIAQNKRDKELLDHMIKYFNCGNTHISKDMINYDVSSFEDIYEKIIPFFKKYQIKGVKNRNFNYWLEIAELIKTKNHITPEGLKKVEEIRVKMNSFNLKK